MGKWQGWRGNTVREMTASLRVRKMNRVTKTEGNRYTNTGERDKSQKAERKMEKGMEERDRSRVKVKMKTDNHHHWPTPPAEASKVQKLKCMWGFVSTYLVDSSSVNLSSFTVMTDLYFFPPFSGGWGKREYGWARESGELQEGDKFIISGPSMLFNKKHFKFRRFFNRKNHWIVIPYVKKI